MTQIFKKVKAKYALVQFIDDDIYHVCHSKYLKKSKQKGILAKWIDRIFYPAKYFASSNNPQILRDILKSLETSSPIVLLERLKETLPTWENKIELEGFHSDSDSDCNYSDITNVHHETGNEHENSKLCENNNIDLPTDLCGNNNTELISEYYKVCVYCGLLYNDGDNHTCSQKDYNREIHSNMEMDWYNQSYLDTENNLKTDSFNISNNLAIHEGKIPSQINILSNVTICENLFDKTLPSFLNEAEGTDKTNLCMYCGILVVNLNEHITIHGKEKIIDQKDVKELKKYPTKQHFCKYCKTLQTKLGRHLERRHSNEEDVQEAMKFQKGSVERMLFLLGIQKKGDFIYNSTYAERPHSISVRRSKVTQSYVPCPLCKGFYSRNNLRNHIRLNCKFKSKQNLSETEFDLGGRNVQVLSRSCLSDIHEKASKTLREKIFPILKNDEVTTVIAHDELIIVYGNLLVMKYSTSQHHYKMIRNKLRHISRILLEMQKVNPNVTDAASIFDPEHFDTFIQAIYKLAGLHDGKFSAPSFGPTSVTLISQVGNVLQAEAIKKKDQLIENNTQQFMKLLTTTANSLINKIAIENRTQNQRSKQVTLPKTEDVKKLFEYLESDLQICIERLKLQFDIDSWVQLNKVTLIKIVIFNRKRPGDVEKSQILEYKNLQMVDDETMKKLNDSQRKYAIAFGRYITRGKLDSPASVIVSRMDISAIEQILQDRQQANVDTNNPYVFGTPIGSTDAFYKAGKALLDFCCSNNLQNKNLTATKLRKHFATVTSTYEREKQVVISDFMGHSLSIHDNIYRQRPVLRDVVQVGKFLVNAMGMDDENIANLNNLSEVHKISNKCKDCDGCATFNKISLEIKEKPILRLKTPSVSSESSDDEINFLQNENIHNLSTILEVSHENIDNTEQRTHLLRENGTKSRREIFPRQLKRKRATWTTPERQCARKIFKNYLTFRNDDIPSLETCQEFIHNEINLQNRTSLQVRTWIISEKKRLKQQSDGVSHGWSTPAKQLCRNLFQDYYKSGFYPSTDAIQDAINKFPEFAHTSVSKLRSHLQHDYDYIKKKNVQ